ncbi:MAG: CD20-like domain-containing protein [Acidobacteriaceae bacterium]
MAKPTIFIGVVLIVLGVWGFVATGSVYPTALIPTWAGLALAVSGALARTEDAKQRMLWMHVAVTVGLLGFLGAGSRAIVVLVRAQGAPIAHTDAVAVWDQMAMAAICLVFVLLCVRSFIAARRTRSAG